MKKFFLSLLCIMCLLVPWTDIGAQSIYEEGFENGTPTGWTVSGSNIRVDYNWSVSNKGCHTGTNSYVFNSYNTGRDSVGILTSAPISVSTSDLVVSFWLKNPAGGPLSVYISTDGGATYLSNPLVVNLESITDWTEYIFPLNNFVGQSVSLVFYSVSNCGWGDAYHYLDDVVVRHSATCAKPIDIFTSAISQTTADIVWNLDIEGDTPSVFILDVFDDNGNYVYQNQSITATMAGSSFSYHISGLQAGTKYSVSLKGDCSASFRGTSALSDQLDFITLCDATSLPVLYDFNDGTVGQTPNCWFVVEAPSEATSISAVQKYGTAGYSYKLLPSENKSAIVATRQISHAANDMEIDFMFNAPAGTRLSVGLMGDLRDISTFEQLYNVTITKDNANIWKNYRFNTANSAQRNTQNLSVVFFVSSGTSYAAYLDNVDIHSLPSCFRLEDLNVLGVDSTSINISWTDYSTSQSNNYVVEVTDLSDNSVVYVNATSCPFNVPGLNDNSVYKFRVRNVCTANDSSQWSLPITARTTCKSTLNLPYLEDFNASSNIPYCWQEIIPGWNIYTSNYSTSYTRSGNSLRSPTSTNGGHYLIASAPVHIPSVNDYELLFYMYRSPSTYNVYNGEKLLVWVNNSPSLNGATFIDSIHPSSLLYPVEDIVYGEMMQYAFRIPIQGTVYVLFESFHEGGISIYLDDVTVQEYSCKGWVNNLQCNENIGNKTIKAVWDTKTEETQWLVDLVLTNVDNDTLAIVNNYLVNTKEFVYDFSANYQELTTYAYSVTVKALCAGNDTIEPGITKSGIFTTPCDPINLPIVESFESTTFPPSCWTSYTDPDSENLSSQWERSTNASYIESGTASAKFPDSRNKTIGYLNSPIFNAVVGTVYHFSYSQYRTNSNSSEKLLEGVTVWLSQTPSDTTNATKLGFVPRYNLYNDVPTGGMYAYNYEFTVPQSGAYYIVIQATQEYGGANYIDEVIVEEKPLCANVKSKLFSVTPLIDAVNVTVNDTVVHSLEFVVCGAEDVEPDSIKADDIHAIFHSTTANNTVTISGLQAETNYNLFWRNICDTTSNVVSTWSIIPINFTTKCLPIAIDVNNEYLEGFESFEANTIFNGDNSCYTVESNKDFTVVGSLGDRISSTGTQCVPYEGSKQLAIIYNSNGKFYRSFNLKAGKNYEVSVYSRLDKLYPSAPECASVSLFYQNPDGTNKVECLPTSYVTANTWTLYSAVFSVPTDGAYEVGMNQQQTYSPNYLAFDNFRVRELSCAPPTQNEILAVTDHSLDVQITSNGFTSWEVRVCTSAPDINQSEPQAVIVDTVTSSSFTINNLQANTDYWYIIRTICNDGPSDWTSPIHFVTNCVDQELPYNNSFETDAHVRCWRNVSAADNTVMTRSSSYSKVGNSSLKLSSATLVSPKFNTTSLSTYMIKGWVYAVQDTISTIDIGVATDPNDISAFEVVSSVKIFSSREWTEFVAYFNVLNDADYEEYANAQYITITTNGEHIYYLDNISIDVMPSCPQPTNVFATISGVGEVQLTWESITSNTTYRVGTYLDNNLVNETLVNATSATISNLLPVRNYKFSVRAICSATDSSAVSYSNTVETPCANLSLPYFSNFENGSPVCWDTYSTVANPTSYNQRWVYSTFYNYYYATLKSGSATEEAYLVTPTFIINDNNGIILELDGYNSNSSAADQTPVLYTLDGGNNWDTLQTALFPLGSRNTVRYTMPNIGPGTIAFKFVSQYREAGYLYIYNFNVEEIEDCGRPQQVLTTVLGNSVNGQIVDSIASHTQWQYVYGIGDIDPNSLTPMVTNAKAFTISDLQYQSDYTLYVRTYCSETEVSTWYTPYQFSIGCGIVNLPYFEGFEDLSKTEDAFDNKCYEFFTTGPNSLTSTSGYPRLDLPMPSVGYGANGTQAVRWISSDTYPIFLQLPQFNLKVNEVGVSFNYRNEGTSSSNTPIIAGVMIPNDPTSFITVHTCPLQTNVNTRVELDYTQLLPEGDYTGYVVAFKYGPGSTNNWYASVDDITVVSKVKCGTAPSAAIRALTMDSIAFTLDYYADSLEVKYALAGTPVANIATSAYTTATTIGFGGLTIGTEYDFYIRNICNGNAGDWVGPYSYSTFCDTIVVTEENAWVENFDNTGANRYPQCFFSFKESVVNGVTYPTVVDTLVSTAPSALAMKGANIISLPLFDKELTTYRLSFYVKGTGNLFIGTVNNIEFNSFNTLTSTTLSGDLEYYDIDLSLYTMQGNKLAFKTTDGADLFIDSVCVKIKPECFVPRNLAVNSIFDSSVVVSFVLSPIAENFEYKVCSATDTIANTVVGNYSNYTIEGLTPNTEYTVAIRSFCSDATSSDWCTPVSFTTKKQLFVAPFVLDFEDSIANSMLYIYNSTSSNKFIIGSASNAVKDGTKALYISNDNSSLSYTTNSSTSNFVIAPTKFAPGKYIISYDWKCDGESTYDYGRVFFAPYDKEFIAGTSIIADLNSSSIPDDCISLDNNSKLNAYSSWQHKEVILNVTEDVKGQIVIYWRNDGSGGDQPPLALDNFLIEKLACVEGLDSVVLNSVTTNSVGYNVYPNPALHDSIGYRIFSAVDGTAVDSAVVNVSTSNLVVINNLSDNTPYIVEFWGYCDGGMTEITRGEVATACIPTVVDINNPFIESFESVPTSTYFSNVMDCWSNISLYGYGDLSSLSSTSTTQGSRPYRGKQAFKLYQNAERYIFKAFTLQPGSYEISLWAEQASIYGSSIAIKAKSLAGTRDSVLVSQVIGTHYEPVVAKFDVAVAGDYQIGFDINTRGASGYLCIDSISIKVTDLYQPTQISAENVTAHSAIIKWHSFNDKHLLKLMTTDNIVVLDTTLVNGQDTLLLQGLTSTTDYIVSVRGIDNSSTMTDSIYTYFYTPCDVYYSYTNNFDAEDLLTRPYCWSLEAYYPSGSTYNDASTHPQWEVSEDINLAGRKALAVHNSYMSAKSVNMVYSPEIVVDRPKLLMFDYFNNCTNAVGKDDSLVVTIISNGVESEPILVATAVSANSSWNAFSYDLAPYVGNNIKVKFWTRAYYEKTTQYIAIDNFSVSCISQGSEYYGVTCPNQNYVGNGFSVPASQLVIGDTTTITKRIAGLNGDCDTLNTIHIYVPAPIAPTVLYDTICQGESYVSEVFPTGITREGMFTAQGTSSLGCDSNVVLYLTVLSATHNVTLNLCEGDTYNFGGQTISAAGVYTDTTINSRGCDSITILTVTYTAKYYEETAYFCEGTPYVWSKNGTSYTVGGRYENRLTNAYGCDSIEVLNLIMLPTNSYVTAELCQGQNYDFFGTTITEAGTYTHTLANTLGCDSIINLTVTTTPAPFTQVSDYVCEGQGYYGYGFNFTADDIVSDTVVTRTAKTTEGCDSIVELTLDFIPTVRVAITATINEGETYEFGGNSLSQAGEYEHTFHTALGCDSVVTLTLNVTTPVDNAYALPIVVAPNPVYGGQSTFVNREWTAAEQSGMRVEVLNSVGQVVEVFTPTTFPIEVGGIYTSGVYYIRVTTGTGDIYLGRLIVK